MPNLDYDPQNPTDLLGQPIAEGDYVAWGSTWGRSPALCVAVIEKIRFTREDPRPGRYGKIEVPQDQAESYTLRLRPIRTTGWATWIDTTGEKLWVRDDDEVLLDPDRYEAKSKTVQLVKNVVKLDCLVVDEAMAALTEKARMAA